MDESQAQAAISESYGEVVEFIRNKFPDDIDKAYEYFWEEEYPEEFLSGMALDLAFLNFEDWLICDSRRPESFIDSFVSWKKDNGEPPGEEKIKALFALRDSSISLYEVVSIEKGLRLKDLILNEEFNAIGSPGELKEGDVFATRLIAVDGLNIMGRCIYPFGQKYKNTAIDYVEKQYERYLKNKKPDGGKREFLKEESYLFNVIWVSGLMKKQ